MMIDRGAEMSVVHKPSVSVLVKVRGALPSLRPAEQRVAEAVIADPAGVSERSITMVARMCQTSETTVLRFCRAIGLGGYPELRIALARAAQWEERDRTAGAPISADIEPGDSMSDIVAKITHAEMRAVEDTAAMLEVDALMTAVETIRRAGRVDIYGIGASALVGQDLQHKLHRIGVVVFSWSEGHLALTAASVLGPGDAAIGISHTGTTLDTVDALKLAHSRGATTIAVTNFAGSPIADEADLVLVTAARETTFRSGVTTSRIAQLIVLDCLFTGVAQRSYELSLDKLRRSHAAVRTRHGVRG